MNRIREDQPHVKLLAYHQITQPILFSSFLKNRFTPLSILPACCSNLPVGCPPSEAGDACDDALPPRWACTAGYGRQTRCQAAVTDDDGNDAVEHNYNLNIHQSVPAPVLAVVAEAD